MISNSIKDEFRQIVGDEWFLDTPEDLAVYSYDGFLPEFQTGWGDRSGKQG